MRNVRHTLAVDFVARAHPASDPFLAAVGEYGRAWILLAADEVRAKRARSRRVHKFGTLPPMIALVVCAVAVLVTIPRSPTNKRIAPIASQACPETGRASEGDTHLQYGQLWRLTGLSFLQYKQVRLVMRLSSLIWASSLIATLEMAKRLLS